MCEHSMHSGAHSQSYWNTYSLLLALSGGLGVVSWSSPSTVNLTLGIDRCSLRESIESRPESSFSCADDDDAEPKCGSNLNPASGH